MYMPIRIPIKRNPINAIQYSDIIFILLHKDTLIFYQYQIFYIVRINATNPINTTNIIT